MSAFDSELYTLICGSKEEAWTGALTGPFGPFAVPNYLGWWIKA